MTPKSERLVDDVATFARDHVSSWDIDPAYPVIKELEALLLPASLRVWGTLI